MSSFLSWWKIMHVRLLILTAGKSNCSRSRGKQIMKRKPPGWRSRSRGRLAERRSEKIPHRSTRIYGELYVRAIIPIRHYVCNDLFLIFFNGGAKIDRSSGSGGFCNIRSRPDEKIYLKIGAKWTFLNYRWKCVNSNSKKCIRILSVFWKKYEFFFNEK